MKYCAFRYSENHINKNVRGKWHSKEGVRVVGKLSPACLYRSYGVLMNSLRSVSRRYWREVHGDVVAVELHVRGITTNIDERKKK